MTSAETRAYWSDQKDSELKRSALKLCDDYDRAMNSIVVNSKQARDLLNGKPVKGPFENYGQQVERLSSEHQTPKGVN